MRRFAILVALVIAVAGLAAPGSPALRSASAHDPAQGGSRPELQPKPLPSTGTGGDLQPVAAPDGVQPAVPPATTTTDLYSLQQHYIRGLTAQIYAYVNPTPTGGTLTLFVDDVATDTQPWIPGLTGLNWTPATSGSHTVYATYSGTTGYSPSTSPTETADVIPPYPSLQLTLDPTTVARNHPTHLTATVTPDPGAGDVVFKVDDAVVATVPLSAGTATYDASVGDIGQHQVSAWFPGNADWSAASNGAFLQVLGDGTTITFDAPTLPIAPGPLTVNVTLDPDPGTGVIQWSLYPAGQSGELPVGPGGVTQINISAIGVGDYTLSATFPATGTWAGGTGSVQIQVRQATATTLSTNRTTAYVGEAPIELQAFVVVAGCPWGSVTLLDDTGGGPQEIAAMTAAYCNDSGVTFVYAPGPLAIGAHVLRARYDGGPSLASSTSAPVTITVAADTAVHASFKPSLSTVYAYRDGYRDTVTLGGRLDEKATVTVRVYSSGGTLKRSWPLGTKAIGAYGVKWNGTTKSGTKVPAGKYTVKASFKDVLGHTRTISGTVTVSWRQARWVTPAAIVRYGDQLKYYGTPGAGLYKSSDYSRGRTMDSGEMINDCNPGVDCDDIWGTTSFQLKTGVLDYKGMTVWLDGHGFQDREHPGTFYQVNPANQDWVNGIPLPDYAKFGTGYGIARTSITSTRTFRVILYCTQTWGDAWDVHRLKLTYSYAVWK